MIIQERWPALVKSGSNIVLPASTVSIAYLKVGGRALSLTSQLSVAIPALTANTRYQVFCVAPLGVPALVISTNENSVGPVGYASWKLVGSFYADGLASVGFGSFVTITGEPATDEVPYIPVTQGYGTIANVLVSWRRKGSLGMIRGRFQSGTNTGVEAQIGLPFTAASTISSIEICGSAGPSNNLAAVYHLLSKASIAYLNLSRGDVSNSHLTAIVANNGLSNSEYLSINGVVPISGWLNTPLVDL